MKGMIFINKKKIDVKNGLDKGERFLQVPRNKDLINKHKYGTTELLNALLLMSAMYDMFKSLHKYNTNKINQECEKYNKLSVTFTQLEAKDYLNMNYKKFIRSRKILVDEGIIHRRKGQTYYIEHTDIRKSFIKLPENVQKDDRLTSFDKIVYAMLLQHKTWQFNDKRTLSDIARIIKGDRIRENVRCSVNKLKKLELVVDTHKTIGDDNRWIIE